MREERAEHDRLAKIGVSSGSEENSGSHQEDDPKNKRSKVVPEEEDDDPILSLANAIPESLDELGDFLQKVNEIAPSLYSAIAETLARGVSERAHETKRIADKIKSTPQEVLDKIYNSHEYKRLPKRDLDGDLDGPVGSDYVFDSLFHSFMDKAIDSHNGVTSSNSKFHDDLLSATLGSVQMAAEAALKKKFGAKAEFAAKAVGKLAGAEEGANGPSKPDILYKKKVDGDTGTNYAGSGVSQTHGELHYEPQKLLDAQHENYNFRHLKAHKSSTGEDLNAHKASQYFYEAKQEVVRYEHHGTQEAIKNGHVFEGGGNAKFAFYKADKDIGLSDGKATKWIQIRFSENGPIYIRHSHPVSVDDVQKFIKDAK